MADLVRPGWLNPAVDRLGRLVRRSVAARRLALRARFGDVRRTGPLTTWGYERGEPVDRWYIERFLTGHRGDVGGHVLEVKEDSYATALGAASVDVVDIDPANPHATVVGDLCDPATLAGIRADAVVLTQTLQYLSDPVAGLRNVLTCLRPGGLLLVTVPCAQRVDGAADLWRWTPAGLRRHLIAALDERPAAVEVVGLGNGLTARASLFGLAADDLDEEVLAASDPALPLLAAARVRLS